MINGVAFYDPAWDDEALMAASTYVDGLRERLAVGEQRVTSQALMGASVAGTLVDEARIQACDMIVMSSHALTGVARAVVGSVADAVVRSADCPVLVVKTSAVMAATPVPATEPVAGAMAPARSPA
jgi:nucleotide-binding universal stress UspA family protein